MGLRLAWPVVVSCPQTAISDTIAALLEVVTRDAADSGKSEAPSGGLLGMA